MDFKALLNKFDQSSPGTDAYQAVKIGCTELIKSEPDNAVFYFLISRFARSYVLLHEEEAVTILVAEKAKKQMTDYLTRIQSVLEHPSAELRLSSLNSIVLDYLQSERIF